MAPTLVASGKQDLFSLVYEAQHLVTKIKHSNHVEFDCGHVIPIEETEALTRAIIEFLA